MGKIIDKEKFDDEICKLSDYMDSRKLTIKERIAICNNYIISLNGYVLSEVIKNDFRR